MFLSLKALFNLGHCFHPHSANLRKDRKPGYLFFPVLRCPPWSSQASLANLLAAPYFSPFFFPPSYVLECGHICLREQKNLKVIGVFLGKLLMYSFNQHFIWHLQRIQEMHKFWNIPLQIGSFHSEGLFQTEN